VRDRRLNAHLVDLETIEARIPSVDGEAESERRFSAAMLLDLIHRLKPHGPPGYLALPRGRGSSIGSGGAGITAGNVATKISAVPWPFVLTGTVLVLVWFAFGQAAEKAARDREEVQHAIAP
jgi:hypothetical protein